MSFIFNDKDLTAWARGVLLAYSQGYMAGMAALDVAEVPPDHPARAIMAQSSAAFRSAVVAVAVAGGIAPGDMPATFLVAGGEGPSTKS